MKKRFTEEQIVSILREAATGAGGGFEHLLLVLAVASDAPPFQRIAFHDSATPTRKAKPPETSVSCSPSPSPPRRLPPKPRNRARPPRRHPPALPRPISRRRPRPDRHLLRPRDHPQRPRRPLVHHGPTHDRRLMATASAFTGQEMPSSVRFRYGTTSHPSVYSMAYSTRVPRPPAASPHHDPLSLRGSRVRLKFVALPPGTCRDGGPRLLPADSLRIS
jgi:hypothetical protein